MKRLLKFALYFSLSFLLLSIRVEQKPIFRHLDGVLTPYSIQVFHSTKRQVLKGLSFIRTKVPDLFTNNQTIASNSKRQAYPGKNQYGHQTYGVKERKEMLNRLSNSLQNR